MPSMSPSRRRSPPMSAWLGRSTPRSHAVLWDSTRRRLRQRASSVSSWSPRLSSSPLTVPSSPSSEPTRSHALCLLIKASSSSTRPPPPSLGSVSSRLRLQVCPSQKVLLSIQTASQQRMPAKPSRERFVLLTGDTNRLTSPSWWSCWLVLWLEQPTSTNSAQRVGVTLSSLSTRGCSGMQTPSTKTLERSSRAFGMRSDCRVLMRSLSPVNGRPRWLRLDWPWVQYL
mmetsp:Transcript_54811/g.108843  ORF Transcript_54811/g.108843 Transcript_54811/m.108843 type:complete len:228 (+) Transcript_54811:394-1077(+)